MSTTAVNPGVSNLLQTLSAIDSPVVSSPAAVTALENAPASDIVEISAEALQVEGVAALFGDSGSSSPSPASALQALASSTTAAGSGSTAGYQADLAAEQTGSLLDAIG